MRVRHPFSKLILASAIFTAVITPQMPAAVIDNFQNVPQSLLKTTLDNGFSATSQVAITGTAFPSRRIVLDFGSQQAAVADGIFSYQVNAHPATTAQSNERGYLTLEYSSAQPVDLLGNGDTAFLVKFDSFQAEFPYSVRFYVSNVFTRNPSSYILRITQGGEFVIPFSWFGSVDMTAVRYLGIDASRMPVGTSFTISSITTIPEPSGAALLLLAALGLSVRKRDSCLIGKDSLS